MRYRLDTAERTKIWFIREEGGYLRPPSDGSPDLFYALRIRWVPSLGEDPRLQFGHLLLSAKLNPKWTPGFKSELFDRLSLAFAVLGTDEACIRDLRAMA